ncbi:MAG: D-alanyl-D-alanine carboxypeptidase family protein [Streptosporangiaceae bacterium]
MRLGIRSAVALTLLAAAACSAVTTAPAAGAATGGRQGHASAHDPASVPAPGSAAAREVGGPLMASTGIVVGNPARGALKLPKVPASAWVVANAGTGQVLAARDPHGEFGPASTLKVLTAITMIPRLNPDGMITVTKLATSVEPNVAGLIAGRRYQVANLFKALLLISANDAAVALTQAAGSFANGMALINAEARQLQAYDVVAKLPNGLPAAGQVESAYDEALIARQALATPAFMRYDETLTSKFEVKPHDWETLVNQNTLLTRYRGGIGGKIGWTVKSEATYIGMARRNGVTLIVTVMHCTPLHEIAAAERLLNWGFAMNGTVKPVGELVPPLGTAAGKPAGQQEPAARQPAAGASNTRAVASNPKATASAPRAAASQPTGASGGQAASQARSGAAAPTAAAALAGSHPGANDGLGGYAVAAAAVGVAGLGLGGLVTVRRRMAAGSRDQH